MMLMVMVTIDTTPKYYRYWSNKWILGSQNVIHAITVSFEFADGVVIVTESVPVSLGILEPYNFYKETIFN